MKLVRRMAFAGGVVWFSMMCAGDAFGLDPCSLLTPAQVASALDVGEVKAEAGPKRCTWTSTKDASGPTKTAWLSMEDEQGFEGTKISLGRQETPVKGIGDGAMQNTQGLRTVLTVKKGDVYFAIRLVGLRLDQAKAAEQVLAKYIVAKV